MATIKEIAELAGVSTTTVSNVIHGKTKKVSPATIQKIDKLIKDMGYVQKMGLRVLNKENSQLIAVIINSHREFKDSILGDPFYGQILGYIEAYAQKLGYYVMFYSAKDMDKIFQMVMGWDVDGVIAVSFSKRNCEKMYQLIKKPIVSIDSYGDIEEGLEKQVLNIGLDDVSGGYMMTRYLIECGYKHIKVCAGRDSGVDHLRFIGAQKAVNEAAGTKAKLQFVPLGMDWIKRKENYTWLMQRRLPETVLFFLSDLYALEAISYFSSYGLRIPDDIGIAGYDDISFAQIAAPRLTTVHQNVEEKARLSVEILMEKIRKEEVEREKDIKLPVRLVVRKSTSYQKSEKE